MGQVVGTELPRQPRNFTPHPTAVDADTVRDPVGRVFDVPISVSGWRLLRRCVFAPFSLEFVSVIRLLPS